MTEKPAKVLFVSNGDEFVIEPNILVIQCVCGDKLLTAEAPHITIGALWLELLCSKCYRAHKIWRQS